MGKRPRVASRASSPGQAPGAAPAAGQSLPSQVPVDLQETAVKVSRELAALSDKLKQDLAGKPISLGALPQEFLDNAGQLSEQLTNLIALAKGTMTEEQGRREQMDLTQDSSGANTGPMPDAAAPGSAQHDVIDLTMDSPRQQPAAHHAAQEQDQPDVPQSRAQRAEPAAQRGDVPHPGPQDVARLRADLDKDLQEVKDSLGKRLGADKKMVYDTHKSGQEIGLRLMAEAKPAKPAPSKPVMHSTCAYMTYPMHDPSTMRRDEPVLNSKGLPAEKDASGAYVIFTCTKCHIQREKKEGASTERYKNVSLALKADPPGKHFRNLYVEFKNDSNKKLDASAKFYLEKYHVRGAANIPVVRWWQKVVPKDGKKDVPFYLQFPSLDACKEFMDTVAARQG